MDGFKTCCLDEAVLCLIRARMRCISYEKISMEIFRPQKAKRGRSRRYSAVFLPVIQFPRKFSRYTLKTVRADRRANQHFVTTIYASRRSHES